MAFTDSIRFDRITSDLFDTVAMNVAKTISEDHRGEKHKNSNKSTQLRKYYDELCMWDQKIKQNPESYKEYLPLIKMLNAKVAYAHGRKNSGYPLVDENFVKLMRHCLRQVNDNAESFRNCKLFFEAFMGFYKVYKPQ